MGIQPPHPRGPGARRLQDARHEPDRAKASKQLNPAIPIVLITAYGSIASAVIELLCTVGFPAVYTQILTPQQLPWWEYYAYMGLYNLAYMLDDSLMLTVAVVTLGYHKLQEQDGRWLKLISGVVLLGLAVVLIAKPEWLAA
jgi:hypothetical protein